MDKSFEDLLVELLPRMRRFALTLAGNIDEADDLVQHACEKALSKQHQWQEGTRLDSWLYKILQNRHIDNKRRPAQKVVSIDQSALLEVDDPASENAAEAGDMLVKATRMIDLLPDEQRTVMLLVAVEGYSYLEVADLLNIPKGTVMSRLFRARNKLLSLTSDDPATSSVAIRGDYE